MSLLDKIMAERQKAAARQEETPKNAVTSQQRDEYGYSQPRYSSQTDRKQQAPTPRESIPDDARASTSGERASVSDEIASPLQQADDRSATKSPASGANTPDVDPVTPTSGLRTLSDGVRTPESAISYAVHTPIEPEQGWQEGKTMLECNLHMLENEIGCDVTIFVGKHEEKVRAHSFMLSSRNGKLASILSKQEKDVEKIVRLPSVDKQPLREFLYFLYTDKVDFSSVAKAKYLIQISAKLGQTDLQEMCFMYLLTEMSSVNVCVTLDLALTYNEIDIVERCRRFIHVNAMAVLRESAFCHLPLETVDMLTQSDDLNADEVSVYKGLVNWANQECLRQQISTADSNLRNVLGSTLFNVRYALMDPVVFSANISTKDVLSAEEKVLLFQFYHGHVASLPGKFDRKSRRKKVNPKEISSQGGGGFDKGVKGRRGNNSDVTETVIPNDVKPFKLASDFHKMPIKSASRFERTSGPWVLNKGADAISFRCSEIIILRGFRIYGPYHRKTHVDNAHYSRSDLYKVDVQIYDDSVKEVRREQLEINTSIGLDKVFDVILRDPVQLTPSRFFTVAVKILGAPSYHGTDGKREINVNGLTFEFANSNKSFNGTDVSMGQVPAILFSNG